MNYSDLKGFFTSSTSAADLASTIKEEVAAYKYNIQDRKKTSVTIADEADEYYMLDKAQFEKLCKAYLDGDIDQYELSYIADAIQLSENFDFDSKESATLFSQITGKKGPFNQKMITGMLEGAK